MVLELRVALAFTAVSLRYPLQPSCFASSFPDGAGHYDSPALHSRSDFRDYARSSALDHFLVKIGQHPAKSSGTQSGRGAFR